VPGGGSRSSSATRCWFAYVTYISFAAVIVLKMAAPGGYGAQVNMTTPVALLVLIALVSAVAAGLFFWLKRELGDHTRQDLTHAASEVIRQDVPATSAVNAPTSAVATSTGAAGNASAATMTTTATIPTSR